MKKTVNGRMKKAVITALAASLMVCGAPWNGGVTVIKTEEITSDIVYETGVGADNENDKPESGNSDKNRQETDKGNENGDNGEESTTGNNSGEDGGAAPCGEEPYPIGTNN